MSVRLKCLAIAAGLLILQLHLIPAAAQQKVPITVRVVAASNTGMGVDPPSLKRIIGLLGPPYNSYTTYQLVNLQRAGLPLGETLTVGFPEGRTLTVTPISIRNDMVQVKAGIRGVLNTQFSIPVGGTQFLGGLASSRGDVIIAISVE